ncbi:MAG: hypothetical protein ABI779_23940, partial [Acidobacteriota bacterium]
MIEKLSPQWTRIDAIQLKVDRRAGRFNRGEHRWDELFAATDQIEPVTGPTRPAVQKTANLVASATFCRSGCIRVHHQLTSDNWGLSGVS